MTVREMIKELAGGVCRCGNDKKSGQTFCARCYHQIPRELQRALYLSVTNGYDAAYNRACEFLDGKKVEANG